MMTPPEETMSTYGVECPYCGYIDDCSWELKLPEGCDPDETDDDYIVSCGDCEKKFAACQYIEVTYYAIPLKEKGTQPNV